MTFQNRRNEFFAVFYLFFRLLKSDKSIIKQKKYRFNSSDKTQSHSPCVYNNNHK
jgi:hypothetical protein